MKLEIFSSWDDMMGKLLAERLDFAVFQTGDSKHLYWTDDKYTELVKKAFPKSKIQDHGDYFNITLVGLANDEVRRRVILGVVDSI